MQQHELPNVSRFGNALILAFEPKSRNFIIFVTKLGTRKLDALYAILETKYGMK